MKRLFIAMTVLALGAATPSYAANDQGSPGEGHHQHQQFTPEDFKAFTDARVAAFKAGLELTPEQEKLWGPVEQVIREIAAARQEHMKQWREHAKDEDAIAKLRARADMLIARAGQLKKLADAEEPLYRSLNDAQKKRFHILARRVLGHGHRGGGHWRDRG